MSRHGPDPDRLTRAHLAGTALRHARTPENERNTEAAVAELVTIATEHPKGRPTRLRVDLLTQEAGHAIGAHRHSPTTYWGYDIAAQLLIAAGADTTQLQPHIAHAMRNLADSSLPGIGNPPPTSGP